jgi:hypothetical protein
MRAIKINMFHHFKCKLVTQGRTQNTHLDIRTFIKEAYGAESLRGRSQKMICAFANPREDHLSHATRAAHIKLNKAAHAQRVIRHDTLSIIAHAKMNHAKFSKI